MGENALFREGIIESGRQRAAFDKDISAFLTAMIGEIDLGLGTSPRELLVEPPDHRTRKPLDRSILDLKIPENLVMRLLAVIPNGDTSKLTLHADEAKHVHFRLSKPERTSS